MKDLVFYNYQAASSFIKNDKEILKSKFRIIEFKFSISKKHLTPILFLSQLKTLVIKWQKYNIIVSQIAGYHTFLPSLFSMLKLKKHIIILHGTECNVIPEIGYGNLQKPILKWFTKFSITHATLLLPVSDALIENNSKYYNNNGAKFGLKNIIQSFKTPYQVIHNGLDISVFNITNEDRPKYSFLTVALDLHLLKNVVLKGIDLILEIAKQNPILEFSIIGSEKIFGYNNDLPNVHLVGKISHKKLVEYYNLHRFYLQLSISESFGLSLCEAMLSGCTPIVSNVGMMPEIVGDTRFVLKNRSVSELDKLIKFCLVEDENIYNLRKRITDNYSLSKRKEELLNNIKICRNKSL
ncbi:MAG: glycosyltransferase family 4 protein [Saprospiraceae bacterium]